MAIPKNFESIRLSADAVWFHGDVEVTHKRTVDLFWKSLLFKDGSYFLTGEKNPVPIDVDDVAFFVSGVSKKKTVVSLTVSNGETVDLDVATLDIGKGHALYCRLASGAPAKFERKAYYQLMKYLVEKDGYYGVELDGLFYPVRSKKDEEAFEKAEKEAADRLKAEKAAAKAKKVVVKKKSEVKKKKAVKETVKKKVPVKKKKAVTKKKKAPAKKKKVAVKKKAAVKKKKTVVKKKKAVVKKKSSVKKKKKR